MKPSDFPPPWSDGEAIGEPSDPDPIEVGVLVVGAGPAGLAAAIRLGQLAASDPGRLGEVPVAVLDPSVNVSGLSTLSGNVIFGPGKGNANSQPFIVSTNGYDTATTPSYSWWYDSMTGIYHPAAGQVGVSATYGFYVNSASAIFSGAVIAAGGLDVGTLASPVVAVPSTALGYKSANGTGADYVELVLTGTTSTITGTALTATCDFGTASVTGAVVGHPVAVSSTTGADVGGAFNVRGSVTSTGIVTVYVCGTGTPASNAYNVTVF